MNKTISKIADTSVINNDRVRMYHVISEPGDATRYDYMIVIYNSLVKFFSFHNEISYPATMNLNKIPEIKHKDAIVDGNYKLVLSEDIIARCEKNDVFPHTIQECLITLNEISNEDY